MLLFIIEKVLSAILMLIPLFITVAYYTIAERKVMASIQRRRGPNVVGFWGLLQPFADGLKLIIKESIIPSKANSVLFIFSPFLTFFLSLISWSVVPFSAVNVYADVNLGILFLLAVSSLGVYGIIFAGWSSNSRYPFLGSLRSAAQMISYEVAIGFVILSVVICAGSLNLIEVVQAQSKIWFLFPLFPLFFIFLVSILAETNRSPFDLPEAEAELVAGFNLEYSAITFALFFLGEYSNMILMSVLTVILFLGGWLLPFNLHNFIAPEFILAVKTLFICFYFIWVRATFPRYRFDQLMALGWKIFLPFTLGFLIFEIGFLKVTNGLPINEFYDFNSLEAVYYGDIYNFLLPKIRFG